jgi:hypothetical protein
VLRRQDSPCRLRVALPPENLRKPALRQSPQHQRVRPPKLELFHTSSMQPEIKNCASWRLLSKSRQQLVFRNLIFRTKVIEERLRAVVLPHHDEQASED